MVHEYVVGYEVDRRIFQVREVVRRGPTQMRLRLIPVAEVHPDGYRSVMSGDPVEMEVLDANQRRRIAGMLQTGDSVFVIPFLPVDTQVRMGELQRFLVFRTSHPLELPAALSLEGSRIRLVDAETVTLRAPGGGLAQPERASRQENGEVPQPGLRAAVALEPVVADDMEAFAKTYGLKLYDYVRPHNETDLRLVMRHVSRNPMHRFLMENVAVRLPPFEYDDDTLRLGYVVMKIPPQSISVVHRSGLTRLPLLRGTGTIKKNVPLSLPIVSIQFTVDREGVSSMLIPLLRQIDRMPFLPVQNRLLNETHHIYGLAVQDVQVSTVEGVPYALQVTLVGAAYHESALRYSHYQFGENWCWPLFKLYTDYRPVYVDRFTSDPGGGVRFQVPSVEYLLTADLANLPPEAVEESVRPLVGSLFRFQEPELIAFESVCKDDRLLKDPDVLFSTAPMTEPLVRLDAPSAKGFAIRCTTLEQMEVLLHVFLSSFGLVSQQARMSLPGVPSVMQYRHSGEQTTLWSLSDQEVGRLASDLTDYLDKVSDSPHNRDGERRKWLDILSRTWFYLPDLRYLQTGLFQNELSRMLTRYISSSPDVEERGEAQQYEEVPIDGVTWTGVTVQITNNITELDNVGTEPVLQYLGKGDVVIRLTGICDSERSAEGLRKLYDYFRMISFTYRGLLMNQRYGGYLRVINDLAASMGVEYAVPLDIAFSTIPGVPDAQQVEITLVSFHPNQSGMEGYRRMSDVAGAGKVTARGRRESALSVYQEFFNWVGALFETELYPDLRLPRATDVVVWTKAMWRIGRGTPLSEMSEMDRAVFESLSEVWGPETRQMCRQYTEHAKPPNLYRVAGSIQDYFMDPDFFVAYGSETFATQIADIVIKADMSGVSDYTFVDRYDAMAFTRTVPDRTNTAGPVYSGKDSIEDPFDFQVHLDKSTVTKEHRDMYTKAATLMEQATRDRVVSQWNEGDLPWTMSVFNNTRAPYGWELPRSDGHAPARVAAAMMGIDEKYHKVAERIGPVVDDAVQDVNWRRLFTQVTLNKGAEPPTQISLAPYALDTSLVYSIISNESAWDPNAVSHKGAVGLMQVTLIAESSAVRSNPKLMSVITDLRSPEYNVRVGVEYLATSVIAAARTYHTHQQKLRPWLLREMIAGLNPAPPEGLWDKMAVYALAAMYYNAGPGGFSTIVQSILDGKAIPAGYRPTVEYARRVVARYNQLRSYGHTFEQMIRSRSNVPPEQTGRTLAQSPFPYSGKRSVSGAAMIESAESLTPFGQLQQMFELPKQQAPGVPLMDSLKAALSGSIGESAEGESAQSAQGESTGSTSEGEQQVKPSVPSLSRDVGENSSAGKNWFLTGWLDEITQYPANRLLLSFPTVSVMLLLGFRWMRHVRFWNQFYGMFGLMSVDVWKSRRHPSDVAELQFANTYNKIGRMTWTRAHEEAAAVSFSLVNRERLQSLPGYLAGIIERLPRQFRYIFGDPTEDPTLRDFWMREYRGLMLKPGVKLHIRMGYGANLYELEPLFSGVIVEANTEEGQIGVVAQGFGAELENPLGVKVYKRMGFLGAGDEPRNIVSNLFTATPTGPLNVGVAINMLSAGRWLHRNAYGIEDFGMVVYNSPFQWDDAEAGVNLYNSQPIAENVSPWAFGYYNIFGLGDLIRSTHSITVEVENGTPWDVIRACQLSIFDWIASVVPFEFRSTLFFGAGYHPLYYSYRLDLDHLDVEFLDSAHRMLSRLTGSERQMMRTQGTAPGGKADTRVVVEDLRSIGIDNREEYDRARQRAELNAARLFRKLPPPSATHSSDTINTPYILDELIAYGRPLPPSEPWRMYSEEVQKEQERRRRLQESLENTARFSSEAAAVGAAASMQMTGAAPAPKPSSSEPSSSEPSAGAKARADAWESHPEEEPAEEPATQNFWAKLMHAKQFRQYHIIASAYNLLSNSIAASSEKVYTQVAAMDTNGTPGNMIMLDPFIIGEDQRMKLVKSNLYTSIMQRLNLADGNWLSVITSLPVLRGLFEAIGAVTPVRTVNNVAVNTMREGLMDMYQGSVSIVGNPSVKPHDMCYIYDETTRMAGPFWVKEVVHRFSLETGYVTLVAPDCVVVSNRDKELASVLYASSVASQLLLQWQFSREDVEALKDRMGLGESTAQMLWWMDARRDPSTFWLVTLPARLLTYRLVGSSIVRYSPFVLRKILDAMVAGPRWFQRSRSGRASTTQTQSSSADSWWNRMRQSVQERMQRHRLGRLGQMGQGDATEAARRMAGAAEGEASSEGVRGVRRVLAGVKSSSAASKVGKMVGGIAKLLKGGTFVLMLGQSVTDWIGRWMDQYYACLIVPLRVDGKEFSAGIRGHVGSVIGDNPTFIQTSLSWLDADHHPLAALVAALFGVSKQSSPMHSQAEELRQLYEEVTGVRPDRSNWQTYIEVLDSKLSMHRTSDTAGGSVRSKAFSGDRLLAWTEIPAAAQDKIRRARAPLPGAVRVTSDQGPRQVRVGSSFHRGLDLVSSRGSRAPVLSTLPGRVTHAGPLGTFGNLVVVDHGDGLYSYYAHLERTQVRVGDYVAAGQPIGIMGSTGRSTGPHLHFEFRVGRRWDDSAPAYIPDDVQEALTAAR